MRLHFFSLMALLSLACGAIVLPVTGARVNMPIYKNTAQPNHVVTVNKMVTATPEYYALSRLNVRECPSTDCKVIGYFEERGRVTVYGMTETPLLPCPRWYHVRWGEDGGWSCAGWVSK